MRGSHLTLDCAVVDLLAARAEEVCEAVADHALGPQAAAALPPALSLGHSAAGQSQVSELEPLWCIELAMKLLKDFTITQKVPTMVCLAQCLLIDS